MTRFFFFFSPAESFALIPGNNERYVQAGSQLELECQISKTVFPGESPPSIGWFRNGTSMFDGGRAKIQPAKYNKVTNEKLHAYSFSAMFDDRARKKRVCRCNFPLIAKFFKCQLRPTGFMSRNQFAFPRMFIA